MSECVVRMEMPKNCYECPVSHQSFGDTPCWCKLAFEKNEAVSDGLMWREVDPQTRPDWCPIICSLPEGHGELIDRSQLFDWYTGQRTKYPVKQDAPQFGTMMMYEIFGEIEDAPTIVPAEAERSET